MKFRVEIQDTTLGWRLCIQRIDPETKLLDANFIPVYLYLNNPDDALLLVHEIEAAYRDLVDTSAAVEMAKEGLCPR